MAKLVQVNGTTVVQIAPPKSRLVPPNPIFLDKTPGRNTLAASSTRSTLSSVELHKQDKAFRNKLLAKDRRSFLTGSAQADLQGCHLITNIRGSSPEKLKAKQDIETLLTELGILGTFVPFRLESLNNGILLSAAIAILPTEDIFKSILQPNLEEANSIRDTSILQGGSTRSSLFLSTMQAHTMASARPTSRCRMSRGLTHRHTEENHPLAGLRTLSGSTTILSVILCDTKVPRVFYHRDPRNADDRGLLPMIPTTRSASESVSAMAAIINANSKLQHAKNFNYPSATDPNILVLADLCEKIVAEFFKRPCISPPPQFEEADLSDELDEFGHSTPDDDEWQNGLTHGEFKILSQKARDPKLGTIERADAAMMMGSFHDGVSTDSPITEPRT